MRNFLLAALLVSLAASASCGNKQWPRPNLEEESFSFARVQGRRQGKCLLVNAELQGNTESVSALYLQIEAPGGCPDCPFSPEQRIEYLPGNPQFLLKDGILSLSYCGLDPDRQYRWRLTGATRLRPGDTVAGPVMPADAVSSNPKE